MEGHNSFDVLAKILCPTGWNSLDASKHFFISGCSTKVWNGTYNIRHFILNKGPHREVYCSSSCVLSIVLPIGQLGHYYVSIM